MGSYVPPGQTPKRVVNVGNQHGSYIPNPDEQKRNESAISEKVTAEDLTQQFAAAHWTKQKKMVDKYGDDKALLKAFMKVATGSKIRDYIARALL